MVNVTRKPVNAFVIYANDASKPIRIIRVASAVYQEGIYEHASIELIIGKLCLLSGKANSKMLFVEKVTNY